MNHINSTKRPGLEGKAPYELINEEDEDMKALFDLLKMDLIPPDEVHLMPDLFVYSFSLSLYQQTLRRNPIKEPCRQTLLNGFCPY